MQRTPVFLCSARYQREAASAIEQTGRSVHSCVPGEDVGRSYRGSHAFIAIVDARGALDSGLEYARSLAEQVLARRGGLLVLLSRKDGGELDRVFDVGATHYLISPFGAEQLGTALKFVERSIRRMRASGTEAAVAEAQAMLSLSPAWRWDAGDSLVEFSPDMSQMLGLGQKKHRVTVTQAMRFIDFRDIGKVRDALRSLGTAQVPGTVRHLTHVNGETLTVLHHVRPLIGEGGEFEGMASTVENLDTTTAQQRLSVHYDALTGLASLTNVRARLDEVLGKTREHEPAAIATLIGISRLDQVNAAHGRPVADSVLQAIGRRLRRLMEERDLKDALVARLGGAEFAIVQFGPAMLNHAVFFSQAVAKLFERPFVIEGRVIHLACRMGIAAADATVKRADDLLHRASSALSGARELDPNSFQVYLSGRKDDPARLASLEQVVREAAREGVLDIRYQPQVDAVDGAIAGVEALVRLEHPIYGLLPAETLLATAERAEFGVELGRNIMRQSCHEAANWPAHMSNLRLSVNVTAADMRGSDFVPDLLAILDDTGFPADRLTLEITEGGLVENLERTAAMLSGLRSRDIRIAIDDFGTGYSSLAYLKSLPLDYLKIDKTIAADIEGEVRDKIIVRGVVDMARSLGMTVIAEGVETQAQLDLLVREGCNWYQGFLCAEALSPKDLVGFTKRWHKRSEAVSA
ncbi:EAL domain-containing protein [Pacificimonas sp. WHA3]|uniref:EAL domain-containing protein n=1 Tax=Pacificimonas pallii TaxID=2827236 RepID=A0ABS6SET3_9SPHN|nr:bifunctional diguanylate cyclase/phosphodiesterase [Pacificimonas pallii]MBV7256913.1 EAL domain-containing protein [Pacificimonas pallii]